MKSLSQRLIPAAIPAAMLLLIGGWQVSALATTCAPGSTCVSVDGSSGSSSNAIRNEEARQSKEQWNETKTLRSKINNRAEKDFDKAERAVDDEERCNDSVNVNAYWEPNTRKCLDRQTGRKINP